MKLSLEQAKRLYVQAGGPNDHSEETWIEIHEEMQEVVDAKSDRAAGEKIKWWDCWEKKYTATAFARRVRSAAMKL